MYGRTFYHNTIRNLVIAFGTIFSDLNIHRVNRAGDVIDTVPIPLTYAGKEKFIVRATGYSSIDDSETRIESVLPSMGFEVNRVQYAPERKTNTMEKITDGEKFMFNRVPYDFGFALYIATRKIDDSFRIIEQILPYFTPQLNVQIRDKDDFDINSNVPFVLNSVDFDIDADGDFNNRRTVIWTLQFTAKAYLYAAVRNYGLIKKAIVDISDSDNNQFYEGYLTSIDPLNAGPLDQHTVNEEITTVDRHANIVNGAFGQVVAATLS